MDLEKIRLIIEDKYTELTRTVIEALKGTMTESEGVASASVWNAFAELVQDEAEDTDYDDLISEYCLDLMEDLSPIELKLLWLGSGGCLDWEEEGQEADFPDTERIQQDVLEELFSWIEQNAADDELDDIEEEGPAYH